MQWVTRERPKVDRIACPWLIGRFVDPEAEFLYVPADKVLTVAEQTGAIPYDVPGEWQLVPTDMHRREQQTMQRAADRQHDAAVQGQHRREHGAHDDVGSAWTEARHKPLSQAAAEHDGDDDER